MIKGKSRKGSSDVRGCHERRCHDLPLACLKEAHLTSMIFNNTPYMNLKKPRTITGQLKHMTCSSYVGMSNVATLGISTLTHAGRGML